MIKLHKKNLLSLRNKAIRENKDFKYEIVDILYQIITLYIEII